MAKIAKRVGISRRDFMNGVAFTVAAGSYLSPLELLASTSAYYPPALMGLRGSHVGSFEIAHAVSMGGTRFETPKDQTDGDFSENRGLAVAHAQGTGEFGGDNDSGQD